MSDVDDFNTALAKAVPIANLIQNAIPEGTNTGIVLTALALVAGAGIATGPTDDVKQHAIQGMVTVMVGIIDGGIAVVMGAEH